MKLPVRTGVRSPLAETRLWLDARPHLLDALAVLVVVGGGVLRLYRSTTLSLWLDEGYTILFARLPWDSVLGLRGAYDVHPPLYYALVKGVALFIPELAAGRYLSVVAGTATLAVLYLMVARIAGKPAALVACAVAAVSPLAIWYSQEARQYAVTGLAVSVAYLALVAFHGRPRIRWAIAYCIASASAVYLDYSALYALAPQLFLLPIVVYSHRRRAMPIIVGGVIAAVAYLPWLPNVVGTVHALGNARANYLEATPTAISNSLVSITGLGGQGIYFASSRPSMLDQLGGLNQALGAVAFPAVVLGGIALSRHRFGMTLAFALSGAVVIAALLFSQLSPGFAPRTVSYAVLGWALLLGAAAAGGRMPIPRRIAGLFVVGVVVMASIVSVRAEFSGQKQDWRAWAAGVKEAAQFGYPVVTFPGVAWTFVDAYQPGAIIGPHLALDDATDLTALGSFVDGRPAVWVASTDIPSGAGIDPFLRAAGFEKAARQEYFYALSVNLYVRSGVTLGNPVPLNTEFTQFLAGTPGWDLPAARSSVQPTDRGPELTLSNPGGGEVSAVLRMSGAPQRLYGLTFEARSRLGSGGMRAFLICEGAGGLLTVAPDGAGASVAADSIWHTLTFSALCPYGTDHIRIDLRNAGVGALDLRGVRLYEAAPP